VGFSIFIGSTMVALSGIDALTGMVPDRAFFIYRQVRFRRGQTTSTVMPPWSQEKRTAKTTVSKGERSNGKVKENASDRNLRQRRHR
jgi:hypothetical protein